MIFFEISGRSPRESWAAVPVNVMSACMWTLVVAASTGSSHDVMFAVAAPLPLASIPLAARTTRCAASSRWSMCTDPANESFTGPNATFTFPFQVVSSTCSVSSAPGMHGAIFSTSSRYAHNGSTGCATTNSFSMSIPTSCESATVPDAARSGARLG